MSLSRRASATNEMSTQAPLINVYTDGACKGNPGIGGWGAVLEYGDRTRELCGGQTLATNSQMELLAVIRALQSLKRPCRIKLHTDSKYVQQGISVWIHEWKKRGWKTVSNKPVKNEILWRELDKLAAPHEIE